MSGPYPYSSTSLSKLETVHPDLRKLAFEVAKHVDVTIICGHRSVIEQDRLYHEGKSRVQGGKSKHNTVPSDAIDMGMYPLDWSNREHWLLFAGFVKGVAAMLGIKIRAGADWDGDWDTTDQMFHDMPHFELIHK